MQLAPKAVLSVATPGSFIWGYKPEGLGDGSPQVGSRVEAPIGVWGQTMSMRTLKCVPKTLQ